MGWLSETGELHAVNAAFEALLSHVAAWPTDPEQTQLYEVAAGVPLRWARCAEVPAWQTIVRLPSLSDRSWMFSVLPAEEEGGRYVLLQDVTKFCAEGTALMTDFYDRIRHIAYEVPFMLAAFDAQGILRVWSRRAEELTGILGTEVLGQPDVWRRFGLTPVWEQPLPPAATTATQHTFFFQKPFRYTKSPDEALTFSWTARYHFRLLPEAPYWFTGINVTLLTQALSDLRESEANYRAICRATNDAVWVWELRTDVLRWNEGLQRIFGHNTELITPEIGWWESHIHPDDRSRVVQRIRDFVARREELWTDEYRFRRADGSYAEVFDRGRLVLDAHDQPLRMIGGLVDTTQLRLFEENLALKSRQITEYHFFNSHHLRAPVARLMGLIYLFNLEDPSSLDNRDLLQRVLTEVEEMDRLIRNASQLLR